MTGRLRTTVTPGVSIGTSTMEWRRCASAAGSVTPMTMQILQRGSAALVMNHLRPLIT